MSVPGRHSVQNALAAVAVGLELDVPFAKIAAALAEFRGAERRFEHRGVIGGVMVVDDYGHHPTEIAAVLAAARAAKPARIVVAFQPHRYTRTRDLMTEFGAALAAADEVILTDIYAANEEPIAGVTIETLAATVNAARSTPVHVVHKLDDMAERPTWRQRLAAYFQPRAVPVLATAAIVALAVTFTVGRGLWPTADPASDKAPLLEVLPVAENLEFFRAMDVLDELDLLEVMGNQGNAA